MDETKESIGRATIDDNGTITLTLKAFGPNGETGTGQIIYPRSHEQYDMILNHIGGIKPGEKKSVAPFGD